MIDGTYKLEIELLLSRKECELTLRTEGDTVFAEIDIPLIGKKEATGHVEGDTFTADGSIKLKLIGDIDYELKGEVVDDKLILDIDTNKGKFLLEGERA